MPSRSLTPVSDSKADTPSILSDASGGIVSLAQSATSDMDQARATNTRRAYRADWIDYVQWCTMRQASPVPADPRVIALYITWLAEGGRGRKPRSVATIQRRLSAIQYYLRREGHELNVRDPVLRDTWRGLRRVHGRPQTRKTPTVTEFLRALIATLPPTLAGTRDRALLLVGFAGCFRRSELVALDVADCASTPEGLTITVRRSKTDQESEDFVKGIPLGQHIETCPVRALDAWLAAGDIAAGPIFRRIFKSAERPSRHRLTDRSVARIVKDAVARARAEALLQGNRGLADALDPKTYSGHSLRAGFITSAVAAGVSESDIMRQSGHARSDTLRKYIRHATVFRQNAAAKVGL